LQIYGGGCTEARAVVDVRKSAATEQDVSAYVTRIHVITETKMYREASRAWADSLLALPSVLAENAGASAAVATHELVAHHNLGHHSYGIAPDGTVSDMRTLNVREGLAVRLSMLSLATETACQIIRIDEVIVHQREEEI